MKDNLIILMFNLYARKKRYIAAVNPCDTAGDKQHFEVTALVSPAHTQPRHHWPGHSIRDLHHSFHHSLHHACEIVQSLFGARLVKLILRFRWSHSEHD